MAWSRGTPAKGRSLRGASRRAASPCWRASSSALATESAPRARAAACGCTARTPGRAGRRAPSPVSVPRRPPAAATRRAARIASSAPPRVFVRPVHAFERPVLLVVGDHARVPQPPDQLLGKAAGREVLHFDVELALLADDRVDLAELRFVEDLAGVVVELVDGVLRQLLALGGELLGECVGRLVEPARLG